MFYMLSCFDLKEPFSLEECQQSLAKYAAHMQELNLIKRADPIGIRQVDTILDTDRERTQQYFMLMYFQDKTQSDRAVEHISSREEPSASLHKHMYSMMDNMILTCWQDTL